MEKIKIGRGLLFRMILLIFSSVAVVFVAIFIYDYEVSRSIIDKNLRENSRILTTSTVNKVEKILNGVQKIPDNLSRILENGNYSEIELFQFLKIIVENNSEIFGAAIAFEPYSFDKNKKYFSPYVYRSNDSINTMFLGNEFYDYFTLDWFQIAKELNHPVWSEPYYDEGGGQIVMSTYSVPLYRHVNGKKVFWGIITADVSLDWLHEIVSSIKVYQTGYAFIISKTGSIVTHPKKDLIMNETIFSIAEEQNSTNLRKIGREMVRGKSRFAELEYQNVATGKLSWISFAPISLNGWSVGIVYPVDEFTADLNSLFKTVFFIGILGVLLLFIVVIFISRSITSPLRHLASATREFAAGKFDVQLPVIKSKDEISELGKSFELMRTALKETIGKLKDANNELENYSKTLEEKVEKRTTELTKKNEQLDSAFKNIKTLSDIGKEITSILNLNLIFDKIYEGVNSLLDASVFLIMLYDKEENKLDCKLSIEKGEKLPEFSFSMEEKNRFAVWSVKNMQPVFMNDVDEDYSRYIDHRIKPKAGDYASSMIYFPLIVENRVIGTISVQSFKKNAYTQTHLDIFSNLANYAAIALDNAYAYEAINKANKHLMEAQAQLIQAEKMASLGQLTAGIAHEIKNPLNFINNFSELSGELSDELKDIIEKYKDKIEPDDFSEVTDLLSDIQHNVQKIKEHGKRADSIVKGMLLHSRGKAGEMQKTNLNDVLDEYLKLAYHGFRAQDASFNVKLETEFDKSLESINVVPQNISRVFLNTINNACYSVNEKKKERGEKFNPVVKVSTKNFADKVEVIIWDNGKGISQEYLDKVFNPFFTTKPTGKGTGLGLSLSYDIVVQEHNGDIKADSVEGEYAQFTITIPKNLK